MPEPLLSSDRRPNQLMGDQYKDHRAKHDCASRRATASQYRQSQPGGTSVGDWATSVGTTQQLQTTPFLSQASVMSQLHAQCDVQSKRNKLELRRPTPDEVLFRP